jgi:methionyl-tRNA synthetase
MHTYYITTPIYYVNGYPHIGHAYTSIACDVMARFMRMSGYEVKFLTGTDEHGQKVEQSALKQNLLAKDFADVMSKNFYKLSKSLNLSNDDFIRTTEERHKKSAIALWSRLVEEGYIYLGKYCGWYSTRDEAFYSESEIIDNKAPTGAPVEWVEEPSYFFALSKFQDKLLELYESKTIIIEPEARRNEVISFIKSGLMDLSVSRTSFKWGIEIPGSEQQHVMYVWLDALANYLSAVGYPDKNCDSYKKFWPADLHVVGKDILRFHAVYWPAFLLAAGLPCPKKIVAHGWWLNEGEKISKSLGNVIDPLDLVAEYGIDQVRYFLLREVPFGQDGNFTKLSIHNRINSELANNIGNLAQRTLSFIHKNADAMVPDVNVQLLYKEALLSSIKNKIVIYKEMMMQQKFNQALDVVINIANEANLFIDSQAPWSLKKTNQQRMREVLYILIETIRYIAVLLTPFVPNSMKNLIEQLGFDSQKIKFENLNIENALIPRTPLPTPYAIFPRVTLL